MSVTFTVTQKERLTALDADESILDSTFADVNERNDFYRKTEHLYVKRGKVIGR